MLEHAARTLGATTLAITDSPVSLAAQVADHVLVARTESVGPRLGLSGVITLLEALIALIALREPDRSRRATRAASALYFDQNVLGTPEGDPPRLDAWQRRLDQEDGANASFVDSREARMVRSSSRCVTLAVLVANRLSIASDRTSALCSPRSAPTGTRMGSPS